MEQKRSRARTCHRMRRSAEAQSDKLKITLLKSILSQLLTLFQPRSESSTTGERQNLTRSLYTFLFHFRILLWKTRFSPVHVNANFVSGLEFALNIDFKHYYSRSVSPCILEADNAPRNDVCTKCEGDREQRWCERDGKLEGR